MEDGSRQWIVTCGIGCLLLVVFACLLVLGGYVGVRKMIRSAEETTAGIDALSESFGHMSDFTPEPDGAVPAERLEIFLRSRERCDAERSTLEATLAQLGGSDVGAEDASVVNVARSVRAGLSIMPQMIRYLNARHEALLAEGMGLGEYIYLYTLVYASWLDKPIADGPPFVLVGGEVRVGASEDEVRGRREIEIRHRLNRVAIPVLHNQLEALTGRGEAGNAEWTESLRTELMMLQTDPERLPWQDGLPPQTATSFEPYLDALEASYSGLCHPIELAVIQ